MSLTPRAPPILARKLSLLTAPKCCRICRPPSLVLADLWADRWIRFCPPTWMARPCRPRRRPPRSSGSRAELRNVTTGPVSINQESTYQPDTTWRWMGSVAMDGQGNLAMGFSASSSTIHPQLRYAARLATDPLNTMGQGEAHLFDGAGSQSGTGNRWGAYSSLTVDAVDDATFWYTNEYYSA